VYKLKQKPIPKREETLSSSSTFLRFGHGPGVSFMGNWYRSYRRGPFTLCNISRSLFWDSPHFTQDVRVFVRTHKSVSWLFFLSLPDCQFTQKLWSWKVDYPWFIAASFESWNCLSHTHTRRYITARYTQAHVSCIFCCQHVSVCLSELQPQNFEPHTLFVDISLRLLSFPEPFFNLRVYLLPSDVSLGSVLLLSR